jgi:hypothetical protein
MVGNREVPDFIPADFVLSTDRVYQAGWDCVKTIGSQISNRHPATDGRLFILMVFFAFTGRRARKRAPEAHGHKLRDPSRGQPPALRTFCLRRV